MKSRHMIAGGLSGLALVAAAGAALAAATPQQAAQAERRAPREHAPVTRDQFVAQRVDRLRAADANGDGQVTAEELQAAGAARRAEHADARFTRLDADSDGAISRAEFDASAERRPERAGAQRREGRGPHRMGPGRRGGEDRGMTQRGPVVIADVEARAGEQFARLDADSDGVISAEEHRAGRQVARDRRPEGRTEGRPERRGGPRGPRPAPEQASPAAPVSE